jgi:cytochrome c5
MPQSTHSTLKHVLSSALIITLVVSCASLEKAAPPVSSLKLPKQADAVKLGKGRQIYATSCTHCHGPARIDKHGNDEKWSHSILPKMCEKAKLSPADSEALTYYVITARDALAKSR